MQEFRKDTEGPDLKSLLDSTFVYQDKHYNRISKHLRNGYFIDYIVSQMTLQAPESHDVPESSSLKKKRKRSTSGSDLLINEAKKHK